MEKDVNCTKMIYIKNLFPLFQVVHALAAPPSCCPSSILSCWVQTSSSNITPYFILMFHSVSCLSWWATQPNVLLWDCFGGFEMLGLATLSLKTKTKKTQRSNTLKGISRMFREHLKISHTQLCLLGKPTFFYCFYLVVLCPPLVLCILSVALSALLCLTWQVLFRVQVWGIS